MLYLRSTGKNNFHSASSSNQASNNRLDIHFSERIQVKQSSQIWHSWSETLNNLGVKDLIAVMLEALGPLSVLGAQLVYMGQPFLDPFFSEGYLDFLANTLEDPKKTRAFVAILRESDQPAEHITRKGLQQ
jgi:hypothetical protein